MSALNVLNVLIVGNGDINGLLEQRLRSEGFSAEVLPDIPDIVRMRGRPGAYEVTASGKKYKAAGVIVTEQPYTDGPDLFHAKALNLLQPGTVETLKAAKGRIKAAILLDYCEESPEWLTVRAYEAAISLARAKKDVVFLSMFAKAASAGAEKLYLKARQAGVTFIKYVRAGVEFDEDRGVFIVRANDGVFDAVTETPYLITTGTRSDVLLASLGGKLRVADKTGIASEFKYFLNPALTTRKGVYHMHNNLDAALPYIAGELRRLAGGELRRLAEGGGEGENGACAKIDAAKCAFCYSCYRACPHAALEPDTEAGAMTCVADACTACGVCAAICPGEAITIEREKPGPAPGSAEKGRADMCKVFCCENSAAPAFEEIKRELGGDASKLSLSEIPCGGRVGRESITAALASYGKVLVAVCMDGACRHMNGDKRACKQALSAAAELEKAGLCEKRVKCVRVSHAMPAALLEDVKAFVKEN